MRPPSASIATTWIGYGLALTLIAIAAHRLGQRELPAVAIGAFMASLILGEVGGFVVLLYGALLA